MATSLCDQAKAGIKEAIRCWNAASKRSNQGAFESVVAVVKKQLRLEDIDLALAGLSPRVVVESVPVAPVPRGTPLSEVGQLFAAATLSELYMASKYGVTSPLLTDAGASLTEVVIDNPAQRKAFMKRWFPRAMKSLIDKISGVLDK
jgi:hypothetical protein